MVVDLTFLPGLSFKVEFHHFVVVSKETDAFILHVG